MAKDTIRCEKFAIELSQPQLKDLATRLPPLDSKYNYAPVVVTQGAQATASVPLSSFKLFTFKSSTRTV